MTTTPGTIELQANRTAFASLNRVARTHFGVRAHPDTLTYSQIAHVLSLWLNRRATRRGIWVIENAHDIGYSGDDPLAARFAIEAVARRVTRHPDYPITIHVEPTLRQRLTCRTPQPMHWHPNP
ncbi:hypothetical protein [Nocardia tengchongensis]|uniref:hypothetical protein n=1 Tax=Nocardia tengchongensis TaxID=2055889 RepID=UPI0036B0A1B0